MITAVKDRIKGLDFLGSKFEMNFHGCSSYTTRFGGLLTIVNVALILLGIYIFGGQLLDKKKPGVTISLNSIGYIEKMPLYGDRLIPGIGIFNGKKIIKIEDIPRYATIVATIATYNYSDATGYIEINRVDLPFVPCMDIDKDIIYKYIQNDTNTLQYFQRFGLCPDLKETREWFVLSSLREPPYTFINIGVFPCSLPDPTVNCAPHEEIVRSKLKIGMLEKTFDLSRKADPLDQVMNFDVDYFVNPKQLNAMTYYFQKNQIFDDAGDFTLPVLNSQYYDQEKVITTSGYRDNTVSCAPGTVGTKFCREYIIVEFRAGEKVKTVQRRYRKPFNTIGDIGGYIEMVFILCRIVYIWYNEYFYKKYIKKEVIGFNEEEMQKILRYHDPKKIKRSFNEIIEKDFDAIRLFRNVNNLGVLEKILFKDFHRKLIPIVLLHMQMEREKDRLNGNERVTLDNIHTKSKKERLEAVKEAYQSIKTAKPRTTIEKRINKLFLDNLPDDIERIDILFQASNQIVPFETKKQNSGFNGDEGNFNWGESSQELPQNCKPNPIEVDPEESSSI